jgi:ElaB/YqjD/DUF883 family membrane-anchored ribosome-binding protein
MQNPTDNNESGFRTFSKETGPIVAGAAARGDAKPGSPDVAQEFHNFLSDIEALIKDMATLTGDDLAQAKIKLNSRIDAAKVSAKAVGDGISQHAKQTAESTNNYIHENPWAALGASAAVAFLLGLLTSRRN